MPTKTLTSATNVNLNSDTLNNYSLTLTGNAVYGIAHTPSLSVGADTLVAKGNLETLIGGAGRDSLVALGLNDLLIAGSGKNTLVGGKVAGSVSVLVGNGISVLEYSGANNAFYLNSSVSGGLAGTNLWNSGFADYKTDSIIAANSLYGAASSSISTNLNRFDLSNTLNHGAGVANIRYLNYTGNANVTLIGNSLADVITGGTGQNYLVAGGSAPNQLIATAGKSGNTLVGNGASSLFGGVGNDLFVLPKAGDKILVNGGNDTISLTGAFNDSARGGVYYNLGDTLGNGYGVSQVSTLAYGGTLADTLAGGSYYAGVSIKGGSGNNSLSAGIGNVGPYTLDASSETLPPSSQASNTLRDNPGTAGTLIGGSGINSFYLSNAGDSLAAGAGAVNKVYTGLSQYNLGAINGTFAAATLAYTGSGATSLSGNNLGPDTIYALQSSGATLYDGGAGNDCLVGSARGRNLYIASNLGYGTESVMGGTSGRNTLFSASPAQSIADAAFANITGISTFRLAGNDTVSLGAAAQATGISSIFGGNGGDTIIQLPGDTLPLTIVGASSNGGNLFSVGSRSEFLADSLVGISGLVNSGPNTLALSFADTLLNDNFERTSGFQALQLTSTSAVTLGANASTAGIVTVYGGVGQDTITHSSLDANSLTLIGSTSTVSSAGGDLFNLAIAAQLGNDSIYGGSGVNTLAVQQVSAIDDALFAKTSGIGYLSLTATSTVNLGAYAQLSGISTIEGASTFFQAGDTAPLTLLGASGGDFFGIDTSSNFLADSIHGGSGVNTLTIQQGANLPDSSFVRTSGIQNLSLTSTSSVTLGSAALAAGISTVISGVGPDTIIASASFSRPLVIDASASGTGTDLVGTSLSDLFLINTNALSTTTLSGAGGNDTLVLAQPGYLADNSFGNVTGIEAVSLTSSSGITLNGNSTNAGFTSILGGFGNDTFTQLSSDTRTLTLVGSTSTLPGAGGDSFNISLIQQLANDSIYGGSGVNTLFLGQSGNLADTLFARVTGVEALSLTSNSSISLGIDAFAAGISTIYSGSGQDTIDALDYDAPLTIVVPDASPAALILGGTAPERFVISPSALPYSSIQGNSGNDTLTVSAYSTNIDDSAFAQISGVAALQLTSSSSVTLGAYADNTGNGFETIYGGMGGDTITQTANDRNPLTLVGGSLVGSMFNIGLRSQLDADSFIGGGQGDTLQLAFPDQDLNDPFAGMKGMGALSLTSASAVTLGSAALQAQISAVYGGAGLGTDNSIGDTITQTSADSLSMVLSGGSGNDWISVGSRVAMVADTLSGNDGTNTLSISYADTILNDNFANTSGFQALQITSATAVTLGTNGSNAGFETVFGGYGGDTITQSPLDANYLTLVGSTSTVPGAGYDLFNIGLASELLNDSIFGGSGVNTLSIQQAATLSDSAFYQISGIQFLSLASASNISLSSLAAATGISSVFGGTGGDTIIQLPDGTSAITMTGGSSSANYFGVGSWSQLSADSIVGGGVGDTLALAFADTTHLNDSFGTISGINALQLTSSSSVTLGSNAQSKRINSLFGGAGSDTFVQLGDNGSLTLVGGGGSDSIAIDTTAHFLADSIQGGLGINTLSLWQASTLTDNAFARTSNIQALSLTSASAVTLGSHALTAGISTVYGGIGGDSFTQLASGPSSATLLGGSSADYFSVGSWIQLAGDSISGGGNSDTLAIAFSDALDLNDSFANINGINALQLASASSVTLGSNAFAAGIATVYGGIGSDTFTQTPSDTRALTLVGSTSSLPGSGNSVFNIALLSELIADSIKGGAGINTLSLQQAANIPDSSFARASGIQVLSLSSSSSVTLGANAKSLGISTVVSGTAQDTIVASPSFSGPLVFNASPSSTGTSLVGSTSSDLFLVSTTALSGTTLTGGGGIDSLSLTQSGIVGDAGFANIHNISAVSLTSATAVVLDSNASLAGFGSIYGGSGGDSISQLQSEQRPLYIRGGFAGSNFYGISTAAQLAADTIIGGHGNDTLSLLSPNSIVADSVLGNVSAVAALQLAGQSSVTLGVNAQRDHLATLFGGSGGNTISQTSSDTLATTMVGASGSANSFSLANPSQLLNDSIIGGGLSDSLSVGVTGPAQSLNDASFARVSSIGVFLENGNGVNSLTMGFRAQSAGISTVIGGSGNQLMNASGYTGSVFLNDSSSTLAATLLGGSASDVLVAGSGRDLLQGFTGKASSNTASDTLVAGSGPDLFIMAGIGDTNNAYGHGGTNTAVITNFIGGSGADTLQLHNFGGSHAGSAGYQTISGGAGIIDVYSYQDTLPGEHVAHLTGVTGTFSWTNNAKFV
jgi:serralysin